MRVDRRHHWAMKLDPAERQDGWVGTKEAYCVVCGKTAQVEDPVFMSRWVRQAWTSISKELYFGRFLMAGDGTVRDVGPRGNSIIITPLKKLGAPA